MKKLCVLLIASMIISFTTFAYSTEPEFVDTKIYVDGNILKTDTQPIMIYDRILVPVRPIGEALGTIVTWHEEWQAAFLETDYLVVRVNVDEDEINKNYNPIKIDCPAQLFYGRVMIPVRAVAEAFNASVEYNESKNAVYINTNNSNVKRLDWGGGSYYIGETADGFADGYGIVYNSYGNWRELGLYKRGKLNGNGLRCSWDASTSYLGEFVAGNPNGFGSYYPDANSNAHISGYFEKGYIEGLGTEYDDEGNVIFVGNYLHGMRSGWGTEYDKYGNVIFEGYYLEDKRVTSTSMS